MPAGEDVSVSGMVQSGDGAPIPMIKVTIYRDDREVTHAFTGEDGKYVVGVANGKPITIRFDTHYSLNNAKDWHPSVVANVSAVKDVVLDRVLLRVGHGDGFTAFIDALSGYEFGAFCEDRDPNQAYAQSAAERLGPMKLPIGSSKESLPNIFGNGPAGPEGRSVGKRKGRDDPGPSSAASSGHGRIFALHEPASKALSACVPSFAS